MQKCKSKIVLKNSPFSFILLAARTLKFSFHFCYGSSVRIGYHLLQSLHRASVRAALKFNLMLRIAATIMSRIAKGQEQTPFAFVKYLKNMGEVTWET